MAIWRGKRSDSKFGGTLRNRNRYFTMMQGLWLGIGLFWLIKSPTQNRDWTIGTQEALLYTLWWPYIEFIYHWQKTQKLENRLEIDKKTSKLDSKFSRFFLNFEFMFEIFVNFEFYFEIFVNFEFFVNGRWSQYYSGLS